MYQQVLGIRRTAASCLRPSGGLGPCSVLLRGARLQSAMAGSPRMKYDNPKATVDVELPDPLKEKRRVKYSTIVFSIAMVLSFVGIVKYEDANAPVVTSTLYTLRRSEKGREILGENIQFNSLMPWISGRLHSGRGVVDFSYTAVGDKSTATVHFNSRVDPELKKFVVLDWSLTTPDGVTTSLMDEAFVPFVPQNKEAPTSRQNY
jgi:cytochrome c oxidase assembly factor 1